MNSFVENLRAQSVQVLEQAGLSNYWAVLVQSVIVLLLIFFLSWIVGRLATLLMRKYIPVIVGKSKNKWDDLFLENKVFNILSYYLFGAVFFWLDQIIASDTLKEFIKTMTGTFFVIVTLMLINALIDTSHNIYKSLSKDKNANIKIYLQLIKVVVFSLGIIVIISMFADRNFIDILKGLGAMVTVLLIVYKDTILSFVAGISLSANKMLKVGDWISVPKHDADGTVIDISLSAVRVQNWDRTITTIPPYKLTSESFTNWKGMEESDGRRIKRHMMIDINSIHFLSGEEIERLKDSDLLKDYFEEKLVEVQQFNEGIKKAINRRRLTNIGTFKKYIENYLKATGYVNLDMTFIVRQLQSTDKGVPLEIYFFCTEKNWAQYEQVQSDIYDHFFAVAPEFGLEIFQSISARSVRALEKK